MKRILFCLSIITNLSSIAQVLDPLLNSFKQGIVFGGGNCVSIGVIKAAIGTFGIDKVFTSITVSDNISVGLRSGELVVLTKEEMKLAIDSAGFVLKNKDAVSVRIKNYADTCFAVMSKHLQNMLHYQTFVKAIHDLNNGYTTAEIDTVIGLKFQEVKPHKTKKLSSYKNLVIYNTYHTIFASDGFYDESWNESGVNSISHLKFKRMGYKCGFIFCGVHGDIRLFNNDFI